MEDKEFNLLTEPWIKVLDTDLTVREVSLIDVLVHAHEYKSLAGEMPTQDIAILRLLLACMQTIFYRFDEEGELYEILGNGNDEGMDEDDVLNRWEAYWKQGRFSEEAIRKYFADYEERFWLFHPETPFYQVAGLKYGTDYGSSSLYGNVKSSNNKATRYHFSMAEGEDIQSMAYSEAARWLLHLNAFCVNVKNKKEAPGTTNAAGVGRLGRLGLLYVDGKNLFEIIMLNLTPLRNQGGLWGKPQPIWEQPVHTLQSIEIAPPDNLPELYTLQSRRILLKRENGRVTGFRAMNGDYYPFEDDFNEQMTLWKKNENKKTHKIIYLPLKHSSEIQAWREFPSIFNIGEQSHIPGVVQWANILCNQDLALQDTMVTFKTCGIVYGDGMSYTYGDCLSDGLTLSAELLKEFSKSWQTLITDEIEMCGQVVDRAIKPFTRDIEMILNQEKLSSNLSKQLVEEYYARIDHPFRSWLASIHPDEDSKEDRINEWEKISYYCAQNVVRDYIDTLKDEIYLFHDTGKKILSIPDAFNVYLWRIQDIYKKVMSDDRKE